MAVISFVMPVKNDGVLTGPTKPISKTIQTLTDAFMHVGISGDNDNTVKIITASDPKVVTIEDLGTGSAGIRWLRLMRMRAGTITISAKDAKGVAVTDFQLAIKSFSDPMPEIQLPRASGPMEFEIEPGDPNNPNLINMRVSTPKDNADYVDVKMTGIGYHIYLFGFQIQCAGMDQMIHVPDTMIDLNITKAEAIDGTVYDTLAQAQEAILRTPAKAGGATRFAYYRGAGGAVIAPTVFSPATTPRIIATYFEARRLYAEYVQQALTGIAIGIVGGMVLRMVLGRIFRALDKEPKVPRGQLPRTTAPPAVERLKTTAVDLQSKNPVRTVEVVTEPTTYRHTITGNPPGVSYARIEQEGSMRLSTGGNAHYGEGVYAWPANRPGSGTYIDIQVKPGTGVETIDVNGTKWVRMVPPNGNTLPVKIVGTNMPKADIELGRKMVGLDKAGK